MFVLYVGGKRYEQRPAGRSVFFTRDDWLMERLVTAELASRAPRKTGIRILSTVFVHVVDVSARIGEDLMK